MRKASGDPCVGLHPTRSLLFEEVAQLLDATRMQVRELFHRNVRGYRPRKQRVKSLRAGADGGQYRAKITSSNWLVHEVRLLANVNAIPFKSGALSKAILVDCMKCRSSDDARIAVTAVLGKVLLAVPSSLFGARA